MKFVINAGVQVSQNYNRLASTVDTRNMVFRLTFKVSIELVR